MENLEQILKKRILNFGPISISDFIIESNLNSRFGYYNTNLPFGEKKDYITSPEISQMFGELLALWSINCWKKMNKLKKFNIIELGPGSGILMKDFLRVIKIIRLTPKMSLPGWGHNFFDIDPFSTKPVPFESLQ